MSSPIPSSSTATTSTLSSVDHSGLNKSEPSQLDRLRNELIETGYYLGDPSNRVQQNVVWRRVGRCHQLYTDPLSDAHYEATSTTTALQHDDTSPTSSQTLLQNPASTQPAAPPPSPEPAILFAVVTIGYASFIPPCGNWKGPSEFTKSFADVKLTFNGVCPSVDSVFHNDFGTSIENAHRLMEQQAMPNVMHKGFVTVPSETIAEEFRFRHALFDKPHPKTDCPDSELDERFSLSNWPVRDIAAQEARDHILLTESHQLMPVPAYDLNGRLIPPQDYRTVLPGSVARIAFTLTHWLINKYGKPASNTFTADLVSLRVLVEPPPVRTPRKKTKRTDPGLELWFSPTKRTRKEDPELELLESPTKRTKNI